MVCHVTADWERTSRRGPRRDCRDARRLPARPKRICGFSPKRCARASFRLSCPPRGGVSYGGGIFAGRPVCALGAFSNGRIRRGGLALRFSLVRRLDGILRDARAAAGHARLSPLGRSEERAGNPRMASVGENTRRTYAHLVKTLGEDRVTLEWNRGGHFTGISNRWRKALEWMAANLDKTAD